MFCFQILAEREALQQDVDKLMSWIKDTEKQLKAPLKLRFKSEEVEKQLEKMKDLHKDIAGHEPEVNKTIADAEAVMKQSKSPVKTELKNKMGGKFSEPLFKSITGRDDEAFCYCHKIVVQCLVEGNSSTYVNKL